MQEFRREIPLEGRYWFVDMEFPPYEPAWHWKLYQHSSYPFPSLEAAQRFAAGEQERWPQRKISIRTPL